MVEQGVENYLKNISNAYAHYTLFETTAEFNLISSSIESILRSSSSLEGFNETLKLILSTLIDSIWSSMAQVDFLKEQVFSVDTKRELKEKVKSEPKIVMKSEGGFQPLRYQDLFTSVKSEDLGGAEGYYKGNSVVKGKRFFGHRRENSHNSDPYNNIDYVLKTSPKISFPKEARKFSLGNNLAHNTKFG